MNVQEAAKRLRKSEPTIRRWIRQDKLAASMINGAYDIPESAIDKQSMISQMTDDDQQDQMATMRAHIQSLERQLEEKDKQISELHQLLLAEKHSSQQLIEYQQAPFWRRWFRRQVREID